ncbi:MAG: phage tail tube protein [Steroidobacteraceae bacterium]
MALLLRKRLILIETESSYGTDPTPTAADAVLVRDLNITPQQSDVVNRDVVRPYLGASEQLLANTRVECSFSVELAGSGAAGTAPQYGKALQACGLSETIVADTSVTYAPVSSSFSSVTIYYNIDGLRHKVTGCRGTFSINCTVGEIPSIDFTFTGVYVAPDDSALPSATYANQASPLIFKNGNTSSFQLLSFAGALQAFSFDLGNNLVYRELVGGTKEVLLTDRAGTGSTTIEAVSIASKDYFAAALTDTSLGNLDFTHGSTAGNIVDFASTRVDIGEVSYSDQDGIAMFNIPYTCVPSTSGNDEFSLAYT